MKRVLVNWVIDWPRLKRTKAKSIIYVRRWMKRKESVQILNHRYFHSNSSDTLLNYWPKIKNYRPKIPNIRTQERFNGTERAKFDLGLKCYNFRLKSISSIVLCQRTFGSTKNWSHTQYSQVNTYYDFKKLKVCAKGKVKEKNKQHQKKGK